MEKPEKSKNGKQTEKNKEPKKNQSFNRENKKSKDAKNQSFNREILFSTYIFIGLFVVLMGYFSYFMIFKSEKVINNAYNKRDTLFTERIVRGTIYDRNREKLAYTKIDEDGTETRVYPYDNLFAHAVGYCGQSQTGIESIGNFYLLRSNAFLGERIFKDITGEKNIGDNVLTTLDTRLQQTAYDALGNNRGAVVVLNPKTGEILAMVSKPDYDPNQITKLLSDLEDKTASGEEEGSVLYNRATQGLYPPGSTFKIITLLEYLREGNDAKDFSFSCSGKLESNGETVRCYKNHAHGNQDLTRAFANSCNGAFAEIGLSLDIEQYQKLCSQLLFHSRLPLSFAYKKSSFTLNSASTTGQIIQSSIGQGETLTSPMHLALIMSAISNDGILMNPYVISQVENYNGNVEQTFKPSEYGALMTKEEAAMLRPYLREVVTNGTGRGLKSDLYTAYGKTGSAEYGTEKGKSHGWFVGFAEKDGDSVCVSILVEDGGSGSESAVPIAKALFNEYFTQ